MKDRRAEARLFKKTAGKRRFGGRVAAALALAAVLGACASEETKETSTGTTSGSGGGGGATACVPGSKVACYTGPLVTQGVGTCKGGERTCSPDGSSYGICEGQVTPVPEDCATPEDDDCDGAVAPACAGSYLNSHVYGSTSDDQGHGIAIDASGAMLLTGFFGGQKDMKSADFGGGALTSGGGRDLYVVKLDAKGGHVWSKGFGDDMNQDGASIAADASGNVLVTGVFDGVMDFGGGKTVTSNGAKDVFVVKLSPAGDVLWAKAYGNMNAAQQGTCIAADPSGDVLVAGSFAGSLDLGAGLLTSVGGTDIFAAKLDGATGTLVWGKRFGDAMDQSPRAIAADGQGNVLMTGGFKGTVDFGTGPLTSAGGDDVFVAKLDPQGAALFAQGYGDALDQAGQGVTATDAAGSVLVAGSFKGSMDAGGGALTSAGDDDLFLVKLDGSGAHQWSKRFGDAGSQVLLGVAVDPAGAISITGKFNGSLDFGQKPVLPSTEVYDIFVVKLDASAAYVWSHAFGGPFDQIGQGIAVSGSGEVGITGTFFGMLDFTGSDPKMSAGLSNLFVARFAP